MVALNSREEVADILDVNQFQPGRSAYECVAYSASLIRHAGVPNHGPSGSALQASNLAQYWYGKEEGSDAAANTNGMSLVAEYNMLSGMGLHYHPAPATLEYVKAWLKVGYPLLICGAETGMYDLALNDHIPYGWPPSGNHCIVASGIAHDGNLLVHDCANIGPTGVRTGPRTYDASKLQLVSATAIAVPWLPALPADFDPTKQEVDVTIDLNNAEVAKYFEALNENQWKCKSNGKVVQFGILSAYKKWGNSALAGLTYLGLPEANEVPVEGKPGVVRQNFERGVLIFDVHHIEDGPPGAGDVYAAHLYDGGAGQDPLVKTLQTEVAQLKAAPVTQQQILLAYTANQGDVIKVVK